MRYSKLITVAAMSALLVSCAGVQTKNYGEPIFGTVKEESPVVKTTYGQVKGENRDGIAIFRGIPYGGNCDGENRWKAPTKPEAWEGVKDCTVNGPIAMQNSGSVSKGTTGLAPVFNGGEPEKFGCDDEVESENCLVLDVVSPGIDKEMRPVVVYIHGGAYTTGSGSLVLGADKFAKEEDVVVVGVNHRLNVFGYLYLGDLDPEYKLSGGAGLQDLVLALEWVRDNIASFGGCPSKVTIMGESGGCAKVTNLLAMPSAKGLFRQAIAESGSGVVVNKTPEEAAAVRDQLLAKLGIDKKDWKKLFDLDAKTIMDAGQGLDTAPVCDGTLVPFLMDGNWAPEVSRDVPVLVGASADEYGVFLPVNSLSEMVNDDNIVPMVQMLGVSEAKAKRIVEAFKAFEYKDEQPWHTYVHIMSQKDNLGGGAYYHALARAEKGFAPVYNYFIEYDSKTVISDDYKCAWHTADLPLQFRIVLHPECEQLSKTMAHAWAAFIRTGNPSTETLQWPAFTPEQKNVMVFDAEISVKVDPNKTLREALESEN